MRRFTKYPGRYVRATSGDNSVYYGLTLIQKYKDTDVKVTYVFDNESTRDHYAGVLEREFDEEGYSDSFYVSDCEDLIGYLTSDSIAKCYDDIEERDDGYYIKNYKLSDDEISTEYEYPIWAE